MKDREKEIETLLISLGKTERKLLDSIAEWSTQMRAANMARDYATADQIDESIAFARSQLKQLSPMITALENELYRRRRTKKR